MSTVFPQTVLTKEDGTAYDLSALQGGASTVGVTYTDASIANASGSSETVAAASSTRKFLLFHNPDASVSWWINLSGAAAAASTAGSVELRPGATLLLDCPPVNIVKGIATSGTDLTVVSGA